MLRRRVDALLAAAMRPPSPSSPAAAGANATARRPRWLAGSALAATLLAGACASGPSASPASAPAQSPASPPATITYFVTADPQINIPRWGTAGTEATIDAMNALPGSALPDGTLCDEPRAAIVAGDLVDVADSPADWERYRSFYDPRGNARLRFPAYEGIGNHDLSSKLPRGAWSSVQREVLARHRQRAGAFRYDADGYHHSWDDGPLHFVMLNLFPGDEPRPVYDRPAPWNDPRGSLSFLKDDLRATVGDSGRPVVLVWHYGLRGWGLEKWWRPEDLDALAATIAPYNVVLILHGHEHAFAQYEWRGIPVFMAPSPQKDRDPKTPDVPSTPKGFLVLRLRGDRLEVFHWTAAGWREQWSRAIALGRAADDAADTAGSRR